MKMKNITLILSALALNIRANTPPSSPKIKKQDSFSDFADEKQKELNEHAKKSNKRVAESFKNIHKNLNESQESQRNSITNKRSEELKNHFSNHVNKMKLLHSKKACAVALARDIHKGVESEETKFMKSFKDNIMKTFKLFVINEEGKIFYNGKKTPIDCSKFV